MEILRRLRAPTTTGSGDTSDRLSIHTRTSDALEAWADRYGDAFIPVLERPGERDVGVVRGLRGGVPFELVGWLDAPRSGDEEIGDIQPSPVGFTIEIRAVALGSVATSGFRRRRPGATGTGPDPFTAMFSGDVDRIGADARDALLRAAAVASSVRFEEGALVLVTRDPALRPPGLDPAVLDRLVGAAVDAVRSLLA